MITAQDARRLTAKQDYFLNHVLIEISKAIDARHYEINVMASSLISDNDIDYLKTLGYKCNWDGINLWYKISW